MRVACAALVLVVGLVGCGGGHARSLPVGSVLLPRLSAQGLIDEGRRGVALRDLHGRRLAWLPRFAVDPRGASAQASAEQSFLGAGLRPPLLHGPHGWYRLDPARHALLPISGGRVPLAGGATVVTRGWPKFVVQRGGRTILRGSAPAFRLASQQLVQAGTTLLDVATGRRRRLPAGCVPARNAGEALVLACGVAHGAEAAAPLVLERIAQGGAVRRLTGPLAELIPEQVSLSPDGRWVAAEGETGCAASYVYMALVGGGSARLVYGRTLRHPYASNYSFLLGWSSDGRLVVRITPPYCDTPLHGPPPNGVYLVDPGTLARRFVTSTAVAMWNPAPRRR